MTKPFKKLKKKVKSLQVKYRVVITLLIISILTNAGAGIAFNRYLVRLQEDVDYLRCVEASSLVTQKSVYPVDTIHNHLFLTCMANLGYNIDVYKITEDTIDYEYID